jgi:hypothetical protein
MSNAGGFVFPCSGSRVGCKGDASDTDAATKRLSRTSVASTKCILSARKESMKSFLKAIVAGALLWVAFNLVAIGYQPAHAGSVVATVEIVLALLVAIVACLILRWV